MIVKTNEELENLRTSGKILSEVLKETAALVKSGVTTAELDIIAEKGIRDRGGVPSFLNYKPRGASFPFPAALCVSVNDEIVHGIPSEEKILKEGDIITLDLGVTYNGYVTDSAITVAVGQADAKTQKLFDGTREALAAAVAVARAGAHVGDIGAAVEAVARKYGYSVVEDLGGHAVGKSVHEKPFIENTGVKGQGEVMPEGLVIAIEPIFAEGKGQIQLEDDQWTYSTRDGSRACHFEQSLILTKDGCEVLSPF
jgi:methionyl aminopeptidase